MERIEEFTLEGRNFMYIDFSNVMSNKEFVEHTAVVKPQIAKYPECSLYTITNIENVRLDSKSKRIVAEYMAHNKPYVKHGAVIGLDGIKKMFAQTIMKMSGRDNMHFVFTKEQAIDLLLKQD